MKGFGLTDIGKKRAENQDTFALRFLDDDTVVCVVCDGMGGASGGSIASSVAKDAFVSAAVTALKADHRCDLNALIKSAAQSANSAVFKRASKDAALHGMGTTLVGAIVRGTKTVVVNIGDSRAYITSSRSIRRITRDHSFVEELLQSGEITAAEAQNHPNKNLITRALGVGGEVEADIFIPNFVSGQLMFFCSDGVTNLISEQELRLLYRKSKKAPDAFCRLVVDKALERGAPDNVTVVALQK